MVDVPLGTEVPFEPHHPAFRFDAESYEVKAPPKPGDWLARFPETAISFDEYVAMRPTQKQGPRKVLVLLPLGPFTSSERANLRLLQAFTEAFFDMKARIAPSKPLPASGQRTRGSGKKAWVQHHSGTILHWLAQSQLPPDAVCLLGITMQDLYPEPSWNYVFGEATLERRVGVYSLARYAPRFWGEKETPETQLLTVRRSFKVLAHEACHMFSLPHCRRYECLVNGSNSLQEMDGNPIELCPDCLKMLTYNIRFDVPSRYRRLMAIYDQVGLTEERDWVKRRLHRLGCG